MSRKHAGGRCCAAPKAKPKAFKGFKDNPLLEQLAARLDLFKQMKGHRWQLSDAATLNHKLLIGDGFLGATHPPTMPAWMKSIGGKPRTKAQKRAIKKHEREQKKLRAIAEEMFK